MVLRRNVLIFHAGALGDFVLTWPLALALGRLYPQSRIVYVTHASKGRLAERVMGVEWADVEQGWHSLYGASREIASSVVRMLEGCHSIYSFMTMGADRWSERVRALAPEAALEVLRPRPEAGYGGHATRFMVEQLAEGSAVRSAVEQMLRSIAERGVGSVRCGAGEEVVIHPGSGSREKCWPIRCFAELGRRLRADGRGVRYVVGEVERERWGEAEVRRLEEVASVEWPVDYVQLLELLSGAGRFVGNDSGPGHLAGVIGVPTVSLFGATDPAVWRPLGPNLRVLRSEPLEELSVKAVHAATA